MRLSQIQGTKPVVFIILSLMIFGVMEITSCGKAHDNIYGEQKITIINHSFYEVEIQIYSINGVESKTLGSVGALKQRTFNINWRNDCHYDFEALSDDDIDYNNNVNVCGGATWEIY